MSSCLLSDWLSELNHISSMVSAVESQVDDSSNTRFSLSAHEQGNPASVIAASLASYRAKFRQGSQDQTRL